MIICVKGLTLHLLLLTFDLNFAVCSLLLLLFSELLQGAHTSAWPQKWSPTISISPLETGVSLGSRVFFEWSMHDHMDHAYLVVGGKSRLMLIVLCWTNWEQVNNHQQLLTPWIRNSYCLSLKSLDYPFNSVHGGSLWENRKTKTQNYCGMCNCSTYADPFLNQPPLDLHCRLHSIALHETL